MKPYLFCTDFDGTTADTFTPSPNGVGVFEAYEQAVADILGPIGSDRYDRIGKRTSRAPSEIVGDILHVDDGTRRALIASALGFYRRNKDELMGIVPDCKGVSLSSWDEGREETLITEMVVRRKLEHLLSQIGLPVGSSEGFWPQPMDGFPAFWRALHRKKQDGFPISTAMISSGHDAFIKKTFALWSLPLPDYLVTDDDIRGRQFPSELSRRVKPGQLQMAIVHRRWLTDSSQLENGLDVARVIESRERMVYVGDDQRDRGLASGAGLVFGHFVAGSGGAGEWSVNRSERMFTFTNWESLSERVMADGSFAAGKTFGDMLFTDRTGFIPLEGRGRGPEAK